jgi:hypothetical protein
MRRSNNLAVTNRPDAAVLATARADYFRKLNKNP